MASYNKIDSPDDPRLIEITNAYRESGFNLSATARRLGLGRRATRNRVEHAVRFGLLEEEHLSPVNAPKRDEVLAARERKIQAFQKKQRKGSWDKPVMTTLPDRPFRIKLFGDPHMDSDAFDIALWEKHWFEMDAAEGVYGVCIGDWFNNWLRVLSHLWKHEGDPDDAWLLFEHYMAERGDALIAACSGNHDDWSHGPVDPIDYVMKQNGVIYRKGAARVILRTGEHHVTMALRHKWKGHSMYSPAHGLRRAAAEGWDDDIMVGGHTHQDEDRTYVQPRTKHVSHLFQLSAFKKFDDYADVHGFKPHATEPVRDLVIDPSRPRTDPDRIKTFYDSEAAAAHLAWLRARGNT